MGFLQALRTLADDDRRPPDEYRGGATRLYECRDCGAKFSEAPAECHACTSTEIASYEFS